MKSLGIIATLIGLSLLPAIWFLPSHLAFMWCIIVLSFEIFYFRRLILLIKRLIRLSERISFEKRPANIMQFDAEKLANALNDPLVFFDNSGNISFINHAAYQTFSGLSRDQSLFARFRAPELSNLFRNVAASGVARSIEYDEKGPEKRWFNLAIIPITKDLFVCHFRDHSEMHRLARMRTDFVANASHELRTPLTSLRGFIETLRGPAQNDSEARSRFLIIMQEQAERMSRLIDDLLSLSRLETQTGPGMVEPLDTVKLLRHVTDTLTPLARKNDVDIELDLAENIPALAANRDSLIQLFQNLVENGLKYAATGKKIVVSAKPVGSHIHIAIRDYGMGIEAEHLPRLTERFYRVSVDISRAHKGTGLGLAIVKHIITQHRGKLEITSKLGEGSTFTVILPATNNKEANLADITAETQQTMSP
ncbi:ATP-binding protein [Bartonella sp. HY329]|uniref:ATP-binding protein n=1 Tax=unclassified Bartonella TaxID=2645622 RepID=UPI0021CAB4ED|nr:MULTISPECIES: ATP-binding protein [unclassified Bartonella]UXM94761.1 ATP-binding protein [Bartonella sp. HY329]UXN09084.1 ATP-binding protein [Bartonella sp. HY328]